MGLRSGLPSSSLELAGVTCRRHGEAIIARYAPGHVRYFLLGGGITHPPSRVTLPYRALPARLPSLDRLIVSGQRGSSIQIGTRPLS